MIAFPTKSVGILVTACLCIAVWHKQQTEESKTAGKNTADHYTYTAPNHSDGTQASNDGERVLRLAAVREARSAQKLRTVDPSSSSAITGSSSSHQGSNVRPQRVAIAASLLQSLEPDQLAALSPYEQTVIAELGQFALQAASAQPSIGDTTSGTAPDPRIEGATDSSIPADQSKYSDDAAALADSYLRATVGFYRYNQLSILAATRAYEARRAAFGTENTSF